MGRTRNADQALLLRDGLDLRLSRFRASLPGPPPGGWIRAIRTALGISAAQLASRLRITRQAVFNYEREEKAGKITLATLTKAARAMECKVVVTFIPKRSLNKILKAQATRAAEQIVLGHLPRWEREKPSDFKKREIRRIAADLARTLDKRLWDKTP